MRVYIRNMDLCQCRSRLAGLPPMAESEIRTQIWELVGYAR